MILTENQKLMEASQKLKLAYEEQDWGIINADPNKIGEFIDYFHKNQDSEYKSFRYDLFELILASFNEAILENKIDKKLENHFTAFIYDHLNEELYQTIFNYWISIKNDSEFPVGQYLEACSSSLIAD